jgi:FkbM family methyltransferase
MVRELEISSRNDPNWHIEPLALSDQSGTVTFNVMRDLQCSSLLQPSSVDTGRYTEQTSVMRSFEVPCESLDNVLEKWLARTSARRPFAKLDTQGHDVSIIKGSQGLVNLVAFQSEVSFKRIYDNIPKYDEALNYYISRGFDVSALMRNNDSPSLDLIEMDCLMVRTDEVKADSA